MLLNIISYDILQVKKENVGITQIYRDYIYAQCTPDLRPKE